MRTTSGTPVPESPARPAPGGKVPPGSGGGAPSAPGGGVPSAAARRDAEATKQAILKAARYFLARQAHGDVTVKAIAERAGVSPPLVLKYFGSKDGLLARVMSFEDDAGGLLDAPLDDLGRHLVRHVLESQRDRGADPVLRIVFAPLHGERGDVLRANFRTQVTERLAERLGGPDAALRAELAVGALLGLGVMYGIARGPRLRASAVDEIVERYAPVVQSQLTPLPG
ncbi:TetR family transcriptional regulator [Streptomyces sp. NPDC020801]|uniref:TetR/AcrR family transcriptional regulator n=1 Tax=unclassified Streptomyces TaxID=2593676 RepID=UPI0037A68222